MKRIFYILLAVAGLAGVQSCGKFSDTDGDPLINYVPDDGELTGPRALFQEVTDFDITAEYHYNGLLLTDVAGPLNVTRDSHKKARDYSVITYSSEKISKITYNGRRGNDSISLVQNFTYASNGRIDKVSETRSTYDLTPPATPPTPPATIMALPAPKKTRTVYTLKYPDVNAMRMNNITMITGTEAAGTTFVNTQYSTSDYTYVGANVSQVVKKYGNIDVATGAFNTPASMYTYDYTKYDTNINPYTLLPYAYKLSRILTFDSSLIPVGGTVPVWPDVKHYNFSDNNSKEGKLTIAGVIAPVTWNTQFDYDKQNYLKHAYQVYYKYKPL